MKNKIMGKKSIILIVLSMLIIACSKSFEYQWQLDLAKAKSRTEAFLMINEVVHPGKIDNNKQILRWLWNDAEKELGWFNPYGDKCVKNLIVRKFIQSGENIDKTEQLQYSKNIARKPEGNIDALMCSFDTLAHIGDDESIDLLEFHRKFGVEESIKDYAHRKLNFIGIYGSEEAKEKVAAFIKIDPQKFQMPPGEFEKNYQEQQERIAAELAEITSR